jgi:5-methylcytosine-specific restriction protein B
MRSCDNRLKTDELRRFVFRLHKAEDIEKTIETIIQYRKDKADGLSEDDLNTKYPQPLAGAIGEPKFVMPRAGVHIGKQTPLIIKPDANTYQLNSAYFPLIDEVLKDEPTFGDYLDRETWFKDYGEPIVLEEQVIPFSASAKELYDRLEYEDIPDNDPVWMQVKGLIETGERNILFIGPPGTSKTTYALRIGSKLAERFPYRFNNVQFHQSFGYEDFMQGYIPSEESGQSGGFVLRDKVFLHACNKARQDSSKLHVFVIDELNRGDPSRIFGEALTYIERRNETFKLPSGKTVIIPANLVILATMNPYDKSIADLDMAMDRRFAKVSMNPDVRLLKEILIQQNGMDKDLAGKVVVFFNFLNKEVENRIGHAYFKDARDLTGLQKAWQYKVLPFVEKELRYNVDKRTQVVNSFEASFSDVSSET